MRIRNILKVILLFQFLSAPQFVGACGLITGLFTSKEVSLQYVGNIQFGVPNQRNEAITIPVSFNGGKWHENSAIGFKKFKVSHSINTIYIKVVTCLISNSDNAPPIEITLSGAKHGEYQVIYQNPDGTNINIGKVKL